MGNKKTKTKKTKSSKKTKATKKSTKKTSKPKTKATKKSVKQKALSDVTKLSQENNSELSVQKNAVLQDKAEEKVVKSEKQYSKITKILIGSLITVVILLLSLSTCSNSKFTYKEPGKVSYKGQNYIQRADHEFFLGLLQESRANPENKKVMLLDVDYKNNIIVVLNLSPELVINGYNSQTQISQKMKLKDLFNMDVDLDRAMIDERISISDTLCNIDIKRYAMGTYKTLSDLLSIVGSVNVDGETVTNVYSFMKDNPDNMQNKFIKQLFEDCVSHYSLSDKAIQDYYSVQDFRTSDLFSNLEWGKTLQNKDVRTVIYIDETWNEDKIKEYIFQNYYEPETITK